MRRCSWGLICGLGMWHCGLYNMNDFLALPHVIFSMPPSSHHTLPTVPTMTARPTLAPRRPSIRCDAISFINSRLSLSESRIRSSEDRIRTSESYTRTSESHKRFSEIHLPPSNSNHASTDCSSSPRPVACLRSSYTDYIRPIDTSGEKAEPEYTVTPYTDDSYRVNHKSGLACGITRGFRVLSRGCARLRGTWIRARGRGRGRGHMGRRLRDKRDVVVFLEEVQEDEGKDVVNEEENRLDEKELERGCFVYK